MSGQQELGPLEFRLGCSSLLCREVLLQIQFWVRRDDGTVVKINQPPPKPPHAGIGWRWGCNGQHVLFYWHIVSYSLMGWFAGTSLHRLLLTGGGGGSWGKWIGIGHKLLTCFVFAAGVSNQMWVAISRLEMEIVRWLEAWEQNLRRRKKVHTCAYCVRWLRWQLLHNSFLVHSLSRCSAFRSIFLMCQGAIMWGWGLGLRGPVLCCFSCHADSLEPAPVSGHASGRALRNEMQTIKPW